MISDPVGGLNEPIELRNFKEDRGDGAKVARQAFDGADQPDSRGGVTCRSRSGRGGAAVRGGVMRRVVITGLGVVAPNGVGKDAFWSACVEGHSGVGPIRSFDASNHPIRIAGEVMDFDPEPYLPDKFRK